MTPRELYRGLEGISAVVMGATGANEQWPIFVIALAACGYFRHIAGEETQ